MQPDVIYSEFISSERPDHRNILIVGDVGVGKSSLVNLIAGKDLAITSGNVKSCTLQSQKYIVVLDNIVFALHDTPGLHEARATNMKELDAVFMAHSFIEHLERSPNGISLLVFCMKAGRISISSVQTYTLFVEVFCRRPVRVLIVVTHLELHDPMESWWVENEKCMEEYGIRCHAHACITTTRGFRGVFNKQYEESRRVIRNILLEQAGLGPLKKEKASWTTRALLGRSPLSAFDRNDALAMKRKLVKKCGFSSEDAELISQRCTTHENIARIEPQFSGSKTSISEITTKPEQSPFDHQAHIVKLEDTVQELRRQLATSRQIVDQREKEIKSMKRENEILEDTIESVRAQSSQKIAGLENVIQDLRNQENILFQIVHAHEKKHECEVLYARGNIYDAIGSLLEITGISYGSISTDKFICEWLSEFTDRCAIALETMGIKASNARKHDDAIKAYSTALSLTLSTPQSILIKWAREVLNQGSAQEALCTAVQFKVPRFQVYREICDVLVDDGRVMEASDCFRRIQDELPEDMSTDRKWELDFRQRSASKLEIMGGRAVDSKDHGAAITYYSNAMSLDPVNIHNMIIKCCEARTGLLQEALGNVTEAIKLDPSSHKNYERKHAILHCMARHKEAITAFEMMVSTLKTSPDPSIRKLRHRYVDATPTIRHFIRQTIHHMPRILIDTTTGLLQDKSQQAAAFEKQPIFFQLRSSMTTQVNQARIRREVELFYRYVMLSHKWEDGEPLFQTVEGVSIYWLESSSPNNKLKSFCKLMRFLGFQWVWSDTCCIDKKDNVVLQESLVAMFTWYRSSSLTVIYLRGIWSQFQKRGDLRENVWNTRAWTYQEYVAAEIVQFYTEDWKLYLDSTLYNHKESPIIVSEMQQAAGINTTKDIAVLKPGLERVREKLYVASMRQTTLSEDIAYSLLGIFNAAIPVIYGEGNRAVGRLLEYVLTGSGDVTILAWTGHAGTYNSCLPTDLTVYNQLVPPHIPRAIETAEMDDIVQTLYSSLPDVSLATTLYGRLNELTSPTMNASRLRLSGIVFPITNLEALSAERSELSERELDSDEDGIRAYLVTTEVLGKVEVRTAEDLAWVDDMVLVHPWIGPLLDQDFLHRSSGAGGAGTTNPGSAGIHANTARALRLVARLRQQFGALLLVPLSRAQYRRVATDSLIMVRILREASLTELIENIRTVDIQ